MNDLQKWEKFILSGKIDDYLNYKTECKSKELIGGESNSYYNRRPCDKGSKHW